MARARNTKTGVAILPADRHTEALAAASPHGAGVEPDGGAPSPLAPPSDQPPAAAVPDPASVAEHSYTVLSPLKWRRRRREIGETVAMTEAQAETLVALGVLGEPA